MTPDFYYPDPSIIWTEKNKDTGKSIWDQLQEFAAQGWELVSVTPLAGGTSINGGGAGTTILLYTFKRPKEELPGPGDPMPTPILPPLNFPTA